MQHERRPGCGRQAPQRSLADPQLAELTTDPRPAAVPRRGADALNALTREVEL